MFTRIRPSSNARNAQEGDVEGGSPPRVARQFHADRIIEERNTSSMMTQGKSPQRGSFDLSWPFLSSAKSSAPASSPEERPHKRKDSNDGMVPLATDLLGIPSPESSHGSLRSSGTGRQRSTTSPEVHFKPISLTPPPPLPRGIGRLLGLIRPPLKFLSSKASLLILLIAWAYFGRLAFTVHGAKVLKLKDKARVQRVMERTQDMKESIEFDKMRGVSRYSNSSEPCDKPSKEAMDLKKEVQDFKARIDGLNAESKKIEGSTTNSSQEQVKRKEEIATLTTKMHDTFTANVQLKKRLKLVGPNEGANLPK